MNHTLKDVIASCTAFSTNSSVILREGCSLNTEFISAILAALLLASALVGQFWKIQRMPFLFGIEWNLSCETTQCVPEMCPYKRGGLSSGVEINTFV